MRYLYRRPLASARRIAAPSAACACFHALGSSDIRQVPHNVAHWAVGHGYSLKVWCPQPRDVRAKWGWHVRLPRNIPRPALRIVTICSPSRAFLWHMGTKSLRGAPKRRGEIFANYLILTGLGAAALLLIEVISQSRPRSFFRFCPTRKPRVCSSILVGSVCYCWRIKSQFHGAQKRSGSSHR